MEAQANEYLRQKEWTRAADLYNKLLQNKQINKQQIVAYLLGRSECLLELGNHEAVVIDCKNIIKLLAGRNENGIGSHARNRLLHALFLLRRFAEAEHATREWLLILKENDEHSEVKYLLEKLLINFLNFNTIQKFEPLLKNIEAKISNPPNKMDVHMSLISCIYCNISFMDKAELRAHCQTETHEMMIMSDDGHDWYWRPPPRGFKSDSYTLCENWRDSGSCRFGIQCVQAHGHDELIEWKERFHYREMKLQRAREKELFGKSYTEELLEKWVQTPCPNTLMRDKIDDVEDSCSCSLTATVSSKNSIHEWTFFLRTRRVLKAAALLQDTHRNHFFISKISINDCEIDVPNKQEWISPVQIEDRVSPLDYQIKVTFRTNIFGTFRQSLVFDFFTEPVLVKHLCVDVVPDSDIEKINEIRKEITVSISERWTVNNSDIIPFQSTLVNCSTNEEWEKRLRSMYPCPQAETFLLSHSTVTEKKFTKNNYRERMHELLFVEEMARYDLIAQYNLTTKLKIAHSYILSPNSMAASTAKYSSNGELFASISLGKELSEDTLEGRLILMHCNTVYLCPNVLDKHERRKVYEALIEDKGKNTIYLRLSADFVKDFRLTPDSDLEVQIQFQLNRIPYCEWHYTLDKMQNFKLIFPETYLEPNVPWSPSRQWSGCLDKRLNLKQKEAIVAITTPLHVPLPPILVIGPFGTGKTFTLAQAIKELIKDSNNRILLCTHSNSAADLYIKDYLDSWVESGNENARPLRIYYQKRWVTTVNPIVQKYCLIKLNGNIRNFQIPTFEDISKHKIIVVTLSTSIYLSAMGLPQGFFTHILLDEAAQAIECETVTPLALANETTRLVLAGDHMQLGPDIFSNFAKERNLHISLLERLYDHYPSHFPCKILLCENYRAHESIIQFTSESFYDQKLISSSKQPKHQKFYPLSFFTTRGEDVQDKNSTAFYNNSEVYEVVERVSELKRSWPADWGKLNDQSIGVVTPYSDQVFRIRSELRKRRIDNVCVERVLNVQGKQFRAIILSTVRTRRTCTNKSSHNDVDYGFLSNSKLLNTAITRAQSLVAVVGDPIALCSLGRCSKVWERFIQICKDNESLFGITWTQLKFQLDGIELKKIYTLNPLAPEFIPRKYKEMNLIANNSVKDTTLPTNNFNQIAPPVVSPFPVLPNDLRYFPVLYPQQPALNIPRPFIFNVPPTVPPNILPPQLPMNNGFSQPLRVVNPHDVPLVVPQRSVPSAQPLPIHKSLTTQNTPIPQQSAPIIQPQNSSIPSQNNLMQSQNAPFYTQNTLIPQNTQVHPVKPTSSNNKLIQFMNNVHFPEAQVLSDCINLLPQNMSLADMLLKPPSLQEKWYNYLKETTGTEAAEKFKYLLHTTNQKGSKIPDKNIFECSTPQSCESPTFNWYDSPTNQINFNKPVYMRENGHHGEQLNHCAIQNGLSNAIKSNPLYGRHPMNGLHDNGVVLNVNPNNLNGVKDVDLQKQLQRHINEEFANLSIGNVSNTDDTYDIFKAFIHKNTPSNSNLSINETNNVAGPRFYKYFQ